MFMHVHAPFISHHESPFLRCTSANKLQPTYHVPGNRQIFHCWLRDNAQTQGLHAWLPGSVIRVKEIDHSTIFSKAPVTPEMLVLGELQHICRNSCHYSLSSIAWSNALWVNNLGVFMFLLVNPQYIAMVIARFIPKKYDWMGPGMGFQRSMNLSQIIWALGEVSDAFSRDMWAYY